MCNCWSLLFCQGWYVTSNKVTYLSRMQSRKHNLLVHSTGNRQGPLFLREISHTGIELKPWIRRDWINNYINTKVSGDAFYPCPNLRRSLLVKQFPIRAIGHAANACILCGKSAPFVFLYTVLLLIVMHIQLMMKSRVDFALNELCNAPGCYLHQVYDKQFHVECYVLRSIRSDVFWVLSKPISYITLTSNGLFKITTKISRFLITGPLWRNLPLIDVYRVQKSRQWQRRFHIITSSCWNILVWQYVRVMVFSSQLKKLKRYKPKSDYRTG